MVLSGIPRAHASPFALQHPIMPHGPCCRMHTQARRTCLEDYETQPQLLMPLQFPGIRPARSFCSSTAQPPANPTGPSPSLISTAAPSAVTPLLTSSPKLCMRPGVAAAAAAAATAGGADAGEEEAAQGAAYEVLPFEEFKERPRNTMLSMGRLPFDPVTKQLASGKQLCEFKVCVDSRGPNGRTTGGS